MISKYAVLGLVGLALCFAACGSGVEGDLDKSPEEVKAKAKDMDKSELETAIADLKKLAEEMGEDAKGMTPGDEGQAQELGEKLGKIMKVVMIYQQELQSRK